MMEGVQKGNNSSFILEETITLAHYLTISINVKIQNFMS